MSIRLDHWRASQDYPELTAILERHGRSVDRLDETHPLYCQITDSNGTMHRVYRQRSLDLIGRIIDDQ